jgi:hypothetical protein
MAGEKHLLRVYDVDQLHHSKLKISKEIKQNDDFLGTFLTSENMVNSCIPTENNMYNIVIANKKIKIHHYNSVLPLTFKGDSVCYNSP